MDIPIYVFTGIYINVYTHIGIYVQTHSAYIRTQAHNAYIHTYTQTNKQTYSVPAQCHTLNAVQTQNKNICMQYM